VKRHGLIKELVADGCYLLRHGKRHDTYINPRTGRKAPVPRHSEIKESLCELIKRQLGVKREAPGLLVSPTCTTHNQQF